MKTILIAAASLLLAGPAAAQTAPAPTERDVRELSEIFAQVDADRNGKLTKPEMSAFGIRHRIGVLVNNKTWGAMDRSGDGKLTRDEFVNGMVADRAARRAKQVK
jgi:Ca2+-binding EF-hand superfamily protein